MESDHKPLVPLLNTKNLDDLPPWVLRFRLRLAKYDYIAYHIPGKLLYAADALSCAPSREEGDQELQEEVEAYVNHVTVPSIPATPQRLQVNKLAQIEDSECSRIREYCKTQWPGQYSMESLLKPYWKMRGSLTLCDDLLLYDSRIVVPPSLRRETMLKKSMRAIKEWKGVNRDLGHLYGGQELQVKFSSLSKTVENVQRKLVGGENLSYQHHCQTTHDKW